MSNKKQELLLLRVTTIVCLGFGILGLVVSIVANSNSMLLDGLYSLIQSMFIIGSGRVVTLLFKEDDDRFPFGYGAFEPFFLVLRSLVLLTMVVTIGTMAGIAMTRGGYAITFSIAFPVSVFSLVVCFVVWLALANKAKKLSSPTLRSESKAWLLDTLLSLASVLAIGMVGLIKQTRFAFLSNYIDPALTVLFLAFLSPVLIKDLVIYSRELLGAAPTISVQATLEKITNRFVKKYAFRKAEVYALKRGRSLMVVIYVYLSEERPVKQLDAIRLEMIKAMYTYSNFCDTDIVFTLDDRWVDYQTPIAIAGQKA